jgi:hypothetical protein
MSEFKLNRNWNGHFAGDVVTVPSHLDGEMVRNRIGEKLGAVVDEVKEVKAEPKAPKNKAVQSAPRNKRK